MAVILAVSGDDFVKVELEQFIKELNDFRFVMFTTEETDITNMESLVIKIFEALKRVITPYVIINGADDVVIPEAASNGIQILANNLDIAAIKGYTSYFDCRSGTFLISKDPEILGDYPMSRVKEFMKDRDSIFYITRRTKDLVKEYGNLISLSKKSKTVSSSAYHMEHFLALSVASLGKVCVFKRPWRLVNSHKNSSSSYMPASFIRIEAGVLDKANYEWFQSVTENMNVLSYSRYKFLWICHQIRGIQVTLKQIVYNTLYKNLMPVTFARIFTYFILHKVFIFLKKCFSNESMYLKNPEDFFKTEEYRLLKKYYFSEENI
jgi:hypothetical protein